MNNQKIIICGPTASGKSALALELAQKIGAVIVNSDSQQVYKELPILSAQPSEEEKKLCPHFLFGEISGNQDFNVSKWLDLTTSLIKQYDKVIIVGGTGMYINALLYGLSPIPEIPQQIRDEVRQMEKSHIIKLLADEADGNNHRMRRALEVKLATGNNMAYWHQRKTNHEFSENDFTIFNMNVSRETIYNNINKRFLYMIENGAVKEVENLYSLNYSPALPVMKAVGVREIKLWLDGKINKEQAIEKAQQISRNYAKRQLTWFRNQLPESQIQVSDYTEAKAALT